MRSPVPAATAERLARRQANGKREQQFAAFDCAVSRTRGCSGAVQPSLAVPLTAFASSPKSVPMEFRLTPPEERFRREVHDWLIANLPLRQDRAVDRRATRYGSVKEVHGGAD